MHTHKRISFVGAVGLLLLAACTGDAGDTPAGATTTATGSTTGAGGASTSTGAGGGGGATTSTGAGGASTTTTGAGGATTTTGAGGAGGATTTTGSGGAGGATTTTGSGGAGGAITTTGSGGAGGATTTTTSAGGAPPVDAGKPKPTPLDFDGDGKADLAVWHEPTGTWTTSPLSPPKATDAVLGGLGALPVPADFDGDGTTDRAVFEPATATWRMRWSSDGKEHTKSFGWDAVTPVPADYDGDGIADVAVFEPGVAQWYVGRSSDGNMQQTQYGFGGVLPVPADYDGDGLADLAVWSPDNATFYVAKSTGGQLQQAFGAAADLPAPADYDGDGKADLAVYRRSEGALWFRPSKGGQDTALKGVGGATSVPACADYDGDGAVDAATYDRLAGSFTVRPSSSGALVSVALGGREKMSPTGPYQVWKRLRARKAARVVVFGDSVAYGAGASAIGTDGAPTGLDWSALVRQNDDAHWPSRSGKDLLTKFLGYASVPSSLVYRKFAFGGAVTKDIVDKQIGPVHNCIAVPGNPCFLGAADVYAAPPPGHTIVIMDGGGNDLLSSQNSGSKPWYAPALQGSLANLATAIDAIRKIFANGVTIYLSFVYDPTDGKIFPPSPIIQLDGTVEYEKSSVALGPPFAPAIKTSDYFVPGVPIGTAIDAFSAAYANGAQKAGITFVDVRPPFLGHAYQWQSMKPGAGWLYDVVHPNDQGHDAIRGVFLAAIDPGFDTL